MDTVLKYRLTDDILNFKGHLLHRIVALRDIKGVICKGGLGGYVEDYNNLSQVGNAWVACDARVYGKARVDGDAIVGDHANIYDNAVIDGHAYVHGMAHVFERATVTMNAGVGGEAAVYGRALVSGKSCVTERARVYGCARILDKSFVRGYACVYGDVTLRDYSVVNGKACVFGIAMLFDSSIVSGCACIDGEGVFIEGNAHICGNALVRRNNDYMTFKNAWSSFRHFTCFREAFGNIMWRVGCFYGTGDELVKRAYSDSKKCGDCYKAAVEMANKVFALNNEMV